MAPVISTTEPDNVETVLFTHFADYGVSLLRQPSIAPLFSRSFFPSHGKEWKHSGDPLQRCIKKSPAENLRMFELHVENLIKALTKQDSGIVDLGIWFPRLIADMTTGFLFGGSMGTIQKPDSTGFLRALHEVLVLHRHIRTMLMV